MGNMEYVIKITICIVLGLLIFLPIIIAARQIRKRLSLEVCEDSYVLYYSNIIIGVGIIGAVIFYFITAACIASSHDYTDLFVVLTFVACALLGTCISTYCILCKIVVVKDMLIIYRPFHPVRKINCYEISEVRLRFGEYIGYVNGKKVFTFDYNFRNIDLLCEKLFHMGKLKRANILQKESFPFEKLEKENFVVKIKKGEVIIYFLGVLFWIGLIIFLLFLMESGTEGTVLEIIILAAFPIILVGNIIHSLLWKVTVSDENIYITNPLGKEKMYSVKDITKVCYKDENIVIYVGERKVVKVMSGCENFHYLLAWLFRKEGIKFYDKKGNYFSKKDLMIVFNHKCDREKGGK